MSRQLELTVGDTPTLAGTINAVSIAATAEVHLRRRDRTTVTREPTSIDDNGDGTSSWTLDLIAGDLSVSGLYQVEVQLTYSDGRTQTFANDPITGAQVEFRVRDQIA